MFKPGGLQPASAQLLGRRTHACITIHTLISQCGMRTAQEIT